mmetsp:Transcript_21714/g.40677  ORF Transcript_21714/g.40677 Transcript_21714/m.40677 type:complete len:237 (-) Transcript_21714:450-1160(-)
MVDDIAFVVDVEDELIRGPVQAKDVEPLGEIVLLKRVGPHRVRKPIRVVRRPPVQGRSVTIASHVLPGTGDVARGVAARLHDVNLSRGWPRSVHVVLGQHPNRGPEPVASGKGRANLDPPVLEAKRFGSAHSSRLDVVKGVVIRRDALTAVKLVASAHVRRCRSPHVGSVHGPVFVRAQHEVFAKGFYAQRGLQEKDPIANVGIPARVDVHLKLPVAASAHRELMLPLAKVPDAIF